jgi:hypothetical protein
MKTATRLLMILCVVSLCALAQDRFFGSGIDQKCYDGANQSVAIWKQQGLSDAQIQKLFQQYLAQCSGADPATALFAGVVNIDYFRFARLVISGNIAPDLYVGLVRDRERKMKVAVKTPGWLTSYASGDADGDLVPDLMDRCPGTPDLTRTDNFGCPDRTPLAPQPSGEQLVQVLNRLNLITSTACDAASFPDVSMPIKLGYDLGLQEEFVLGVSKVSGQPANCVVLYEVEVHMSKPKAGAPVPAEDLVPVVFRSTENTDMSPSGQTRQVFRIKPTDTGAKHQLWQNARYYNHAEFRVRAINGNGLSGGWSGLAGTNIAWFGN